MLVFGEEGKPEYPEKTSRSRVENQQTLLTYDVRSGNRTRATLVCEWQTPKNSEATGKMPLIFLLYYKTEIVDLWYIRKCIKGDGVFYP